MPRGSSRQFRTKYSGAANLLGIDGTANRLTDSGFVAEARGAFEQQGFSVAGRKASRIFQADADLAQAELGLSAFSAQTMSLDFDKTEVLRNTTTQLIGIANVWSMLVWSRRTISTNLQWLCQVHRFGSANHIEILAQQALGGRGDFTWVDATNSPTAVARWENFYSINSWISTLISWDGTELRVWKNGIQLGAPDSGDATPVPAPVMTDGGDRQMILGGRFSGNDGWAGRVSQWGIWRVRVDAAASFLQTSPSSIDLNANSGAYQFAGDLAHWYRPGHEASPNLGKDFAAAGFTPTIDIEVDAIGITDADRIADVP